MTAVTAVTSHLSWVFLGTAAVVIILQILHGGIRSVHVGVILLAIGLLGYAAFPGALAHPVAVLANGKTIALDKVSTASGTATAVSAPVIPAWGAAAIMILLALLGIVLTHQARKSPATAPAEAQEEKEKE